MIFEKTENPLVWVTKSGITASEVRCASDEDFNINGRVQIKDTDGELISYIYLNVLPRALFKRAQKNDRRDFSVDQNAWKIDEHIFLIAERLEVMSLHIYDTENQVLYKTPLDSFLDHALIIDGSYALALSAWKHDGGADTDREQFGQKRLF